MRTMLMLKYRGQASCLEATIDEATKQIKCSVVSEHPIKGEAYDRLVTGEEVEINGWVIAILKDAETLLDKRMYQGKALDNQVLN